MRWSERIRKNTPFGPLKWPRQPLRLLQNAKKSLNHSKNGDPKEILMDSSYQIGDLQNRLQNREEIIVGQRGKDWRLFYRVSNTTLIAVAQWQQRGYRNIQSCKHESLKPW